MLTSIAVILLLGLLLGSIFSKLKTSQSFRNDYCRNYFKPLCAQSY